MSDSEPDVPPPYRSLRDALRGVREVNSEVSAGQPLDAKLCNTVCQAIWFLAGYYGPTLTEYGVYVVAVALDEFKAEVTKAASRIDTLKLSAGENARWEQALESIKQFKSSADMQ